MQQNEELLDTYLETEQASGRLAVDGQNYSRMVEVVEMDDLVVREVCLHHGHLFDLCQKSISCEDRAFGRGKSIKNARHQVQFA